MKKIESKLPHINQNIDENKKKWESFFEMKLTSVFAIILFLFGVTIIFQGEHIVLFFKKITEIQLLGFKMIVLSLMAILIVELGRRQHSLKLHYKFFQIFSVINFFFLYYKYLISPNDVLNITQNEFFCFTLFVSFFYIAVRLFEYTKFLISDFIQKTEDTPTDRITVLVAVFGTIISFITLFK